MSCVGLYSYRHTLVRMIKLLANVDNSRPAYWRFHTFNLSTTRSPRIRSPISNLYVLNLHVFHYRRMAGASKVAPHMIVEPIFWSGDSVKDLTKARMSLIKDIGPQSGAAVVLIKRFGFDDGSAGGAISSSEKGEGSGKTLGGVSFSQALTALQVRAVVGWLECWIEMLALS